MKPNVLLCQRAYTDNKYIKGYYKINKKKYF